MVSSELFALIILVYALDENGEWIVFKYDEVSEEDRPYSSTMRVRFNGSHYDLLTGKPADATVEAKADKGMTAPSTRGGGAERRTPRTSTLSVDHSARRGRQIS